MEQALVSVIVALCSFADPSLSKEHKHQCMEHYVNCMVGINGKIDMEKTEFCEKQWYSKKEKPE